MNSTKKISEMSFKQITDWWQEYRDDQISWGGILVNSSPACLTTQYARLVVEGDIVASKEVIQAAKRHLYDLSRQGTDDFPWVFDEVRAWRPIRFIERKCKPSKGDFNKLVLQPWQHFIVGSMFGWVHKDSKLRRFREAVIFVGRKNGKTTLESGLADYMAGFDGENGANVYFLANSQKQSSLLFEESKNMIDKSPYLKERFVTTRSEIRYPKTDSKIVNMSAEKNNKDGENLHFGVFDEIHEYQDYSLINVMKRSRGTRSQPLIVYITTAGYVLDGPLMDFVDNGKDTLNNYKDSVDERTFYFLAKLDDAEEMDDPRMWIKANPNFGLMKVPDMIQDFNKDRKNPKELADWITKQFNIFSNIDELSFVTMDIIEKNSKTMNIHELDGRKCVGGYDLSNSEDFTSACLEFPLDDGSVYILEKSWIPRSRYDTARNPERIQEWNERGELQIIPGDYVKFEYIYDWFIEMSKKYDIEEIRFDPAKSFGLNKAMEDYGFTTVEVRQGFITLGSPMQNFKEMLLDGKVITNNSKLWRWYLANVKLVQDRNENWMPTKQSRSRKIDGFAAALDAHVRVMEILNDKSNNDGPQIEFVSLRR